MIRHASGVADCLAATDLCWHIECDDVLQFLRSLPPQSVDLIFGSPPYETRRPYSVGFNLKGEAWVAWMVEVFHASLQACRGLVAYVVEGMTEGYRYSAVPALLMADLHRNGVCLRKPPAFYRRGIPGSGGPDWWRNDYEWIICATNGGRLPWSDNTACGHQPRWAPGGQPSHRTQDGSRVNSSCKDGTDSQSGRRSNLYVPPRLANPGNVLDGDDGSNLIRCLVGGGHMGSKLAHDSQAPFPESLVLPFVLSYCPPGGVCVDPFAGSSTTGAVAAMNARKYLGCDIDPKQVQLGELRMTEAEERMLTNASRSNSG